MAETDISAASYSDMSNVVKDYEIGSTHTDGVANQDETQYVNNNWGQQLKIYKSIPEFKIAVDMRSIWTVGKKIEADPETAAILDNINGIGIDTFRTILKNMNTVRRLGQDAYAEIIRGEDGEIVNLKPLDPGSIRVIFDRKGMIKRYEQISKLPNSRDSIITFKPYEIFHLTNKRIADEIHGVSDSESLKFIIEAAKESFDDTRKLMHRFLKPMLHCVLDTDNDSEIAAFIAKFDQIVNKGENLFTPKGTVDSVNVIAVPPNATLNSLPWREHLKNYFYQVVGMPQIIMGSSGEFTESTAKIAYLAFEQSVEDEQTDIEDQVWNQLGLRIELTFPASLKNELLSDESKDAGGQMQVQSADVTAGVGR